MKAIKKHGSRHAHRDATLVLLLYRHGLRVGEVAGLRWSQVDFTAASLGDFQALPNQPPGNGHKITDWEKFRSFALSHGDKTHFRDGKTLG